MRPTWLQYAKALAEVAATRSPDPYHKVGCVAFRADNTTVGQGYNGPPAGIEIDWSDRAKRRLRTIHAETNALRYCRPGEVEYLVTTLMPCSNCLTIIASYNIKRVYFCEYYSHEDCSEVAKEFGITLTKI